MNCTGTMGEYRRSYTTSSSSTSTTSMDVHDEIAEMVERSRRRTTTGRNIAATAIYSGGSESETVDGSSSSVTRSSGVCSAVDWDLFRGRGQREFSELVFQGDE